MAKNPFGGNAFKQALQKQTDNVLSDLRQKQEDAKPKPMDNGNKRDYNMVIVMRHSKRIDQHPNFAPHLKWNEKDQYLRPYDPPICDYQLPVEKYKELQSFVPTINITKIVTSPFLRCIQTSTMIAKYANIKTLEIDARLGENSLAINRCIRHAKNKQDSNKTTNYDIPKDFNDVKYLSMQEIKKVIIETWNNQKIKKNKDKASDEEKKQNDDGDNKELNENDLKIEWSHNEKAGNHLHVECAKEYKNILIAQQKSKQKDKEWEINDTLLISHGQVLSDISEDLCGKILTVDECAWLVITHNENAKLYSPTAIQILFDKNAEM